MRPAGPAPRAARPWRLALLLLATTLCIAAKNQGGLFRSSRLVIEIPMVEPCPIAGNALVLYNVETKMISKVDFGVNFDFNVTRNAASVSEIIVKITKCREQVSINNCELFQTWRFDRNPCKAMTDPNAIWKSAMDLIKPRFGCPPKAGSYALHNFCITPAVLQVLPMPWEGNVWMSRFSIMETPKRTLTCVDLELKVHRVRD